MRKPQNQYLPGNVELEVQAVEDTIYDDTLTDLLKAEGKTCVGYFLLCHVHM